MITIRFVLDPASFLCPSFVSLISLFSCPSLISSLFSLSVSVLWTILWVAGPRVQQLTESQVLPVLLVLENETITRQKLINKILSINVYH